MSLGSRLLADRPALGLALALVPAAALFLVVTTSNPPGFYRDESAIAWNALSIARSGDDEFGASWPLFFRSFGDYKSPAYVYLLSGVFKVASPSILGARFLSAGVGLLAVALLGLLAARVSGRAAIGAAVLLFAALNPWLFEVSRLVFEVALFPLILVAFLAILHRAQELPHWPAPQSAALGGLLGLMAYTYPSGRLLAPLLALGLVAFLTRRRLRALAETWLVFAVALVPLVVFAAQHPGALSARFYVTSYITEDSSPAAAARQFVENYFANLNLWAWVTDGDPNLRHHVPGTGSLLAATVVLALVGAVIAAIRARREPWWRFVLWGLAVSLVPASLTFDRLHTLRMIPFPIFLFLLTVPALAWLWDARDRRLRAALVLLLAGTVAQAGVFQWQFRHDGPERGETFAAAFPAVYERALAEPLRPIYVFLGDHDHVQAYWYGALWGVRRSELAALAEGSSPPEGALVLTGRELCSGCRVVAREEQFVAYVTPAR